MKIKSFEHNKTLSSDVKRGKEEGLSFFISTAAVPNVNQKFSKEKKGHLLLLTLTAPFFFSSPHFWVMMNSQP